MNDINEDSLRSVRDHLISSGISADHGSLSGDVSLETDMKMLFDGTLDTLAIFHWW